MNNLPTISHLQIVPDEYRKAPNAQDVATLIEIKNLSLNIDQQAIFSNISIPIYSKHINVLIGPSGCGKSSLLNAIIRLTDFTKDAHLQGEILVANKNILNPNCNLIELRKKVAMIFQKPTPFPMSIYKNFEIPLKEHGVKNKIDIAAKMQSALKSVGLWKEVKDRLNKNALSLSGGQQQRLCIARALTLAPAALLLDEPCSALDPISSQIIEELLLELKQKYTILVVTHNLSQAKRIADYVAFMWYVNQCGRLVEHNEAAIIFNKPSNPLTSAYVQGVTG